jgi:hypothetical protein
MVNNTFLYWILFVSLLTSDSAVCSCESSLYVSCGGSKY